MPAREWPDGDAEDVDPREAERMRRRDHDATAERRALLRPGMGKVFKQIGDARRRADEEADAIREERPHRGP